MFWGNILFAQLRSNFLTEPFLSPSFHNQPVDSDSVFDQSEVYAVASPTNENFVATFYHTFDDVYAKPGYAFSFNQGETWQRGVIEGPRGQYGFDPWGAINQYNEIFYSYIASDRNTGKTVLTVSKTSDFGVLWQHAEIDSQKSDKSMMVVDNSSNDLTNGNVYVGWLRPENDWKMMFSKSGSDFNFSKPIILDSGVINDIYMQGINMVVNENGFLLVTYMKIKYIDFFTSHIYLMFQLSKDGGETFSLATIYGEQTWRRVRYIGRGIDIVPLPSIAVHENKAYVVIANPHQTVPKLAWSINLYSFDIDNPQMAVKDTIAGDSTNWFFYPSVVSENGNLFIQYTSASHDGHLYNLQQNVVVKKGEEEQEKYTLVDSVQNITGSNFWTHHYNQIAVGYSGKIIYGIFTDYRNPTNDIYAKTIILETSGIKNDEMKIVDYTLSQNYPNPFNPRTVISYTIPQSAKVEIIIYDVLGRKIRQLVNERKNAGNHQTIFENHNLPSGIYFYRLKVNNLIKTKKMLLLK